MSLEIQPQNGITIHNIPQELILSIFQSLTFSECITAEKVCQLWNALVKNPTTIFGRCLQKKIQIEQLVSLAPRFSAWEQMPRHWGLHNNKKTLKFSSVSQDIISFYPTFCTQSSKFFSFTQNLPFSDRHILLSRFKNTYFLTPQGETRLQLDLATDLRPLMSHTLIVKNMNDSASNREFSLLGDLTETEENLSAHQIQGCFPISESLVVTVTDRTIALWDLTPFKPICCKTLTLSWPIRELYRIGNHLLVENPLLSENLLIHLNDLSILEQRIELRGYTSMKTSGSFICGTNNREIKLFYLNEDGLLEKNWDFQFNEDLLKPEWGSFLNLRIEDMSENFIVFSSWQARAVNLFILNTDGILIHSINKEMSESIEFWELWAYPLFTHISGDILVFKHPQQHMLYFWHLPTKKCLKEFEWTKTFYDLPLYYDIVRVQDIHFDNGKLTILLSWGQHIAGSNRPAQFRVIQFDPLNMTPSGLRGLIHQVFSAAKGLYYALPGKNPT